MSNKETRSQGSNPSFSLYEFEKWLKSNTKNNSSSMPRVKNENKERGNTQIASRLGLTRLTNKIKQYNEIDEKDSEELAEIFKEKGGTMLRTEGLDAVIEVNEREFVLPKAYIKKI